MSALGVFIWHVDVVKLAVLGGVILVIGLVIFTEWLAKRRK